MSEEKKQSRLFWSVLLGQVALALAWMTYVTWTQYASNRVYLADAGKFDFICAGWKYGHFMKSPLAWEVDVNYFAAHMRPVFLLISVFYFLFDHPMTLLSFMNVSLACAAIPLALYAKEVLGGMRLPLGISFVYLTNHFIASIHLANHPESIAFLGFFFLFYSYSRQLWIPYILSLLWIFSVKEDMGLWTFFAGLAILLHPGKGRVKWGITTCVSGLAWWFIALLLMKLAGSEVYQQLDETPISRFAGMGESKLEVLLYILVNPLEIASKILNPTLIVLFLSTGLVALCDWRSCWIIAAGAGVFMITDDSLVGKLWYYYSYAAIPFLFYSTIHGAKNLMDLLHKWKPSISTHHLQISISALFILTGVISAPLATRTDGYRRVPFKIEKVHRYLDDIIPLLPEDAPVAAQYEIYTRIPNREVKLPFRQRYLKDVEYIFLATYVFPPADLRGEKKAQELNELLDYINSENCEVVFEGSGYLILKRLDYNTNDKD